MSEEFDVREHLRSFADPEERARAIHEGGWGGERVKANNGDFLNLPPLASPPPRPELPPASPALATQSRKGRWSALSPREVAKLYGAVAFAMRHYGVVLNAHITIAWGLLGIWDHAQAAQLLSKFNQEAAKWLRVGADPSGTRKRMTKRAKQGGSDHMYIYVHDCNYGFHTRELAFIPSAKADLFAEWAKTWFARHAEREHIPDAAVYVEVDRSRNERSAVARCWEWFRHMTKSLHPISKGRDDNGEWISLRAVFKPEPFIESAPVHCAQIASGSQNIWTQAQAAAGFQSRFYAWGELGKLYDGSELEERRLEISQAEHRAEMEAMQKTMNLEGHKQTGWAW